jgi:hypothetical protein
MELQRCYYLLLDACRSEIASPVCDAECGESKACGGYAGNEVSIECPGAGFIVGAVQHLSGGWVGLLGEVETGALLNVLEKDEVIVA